MKLLYALLLPLAIILPACSHDDEPDRTGVLPPPSVDEGGESPDSYDFSPEVADPTPRIVATDGSLSLRYDRPGVMVVEGPDGSTRFIDIATDIDASLTVTASDTLLAVRSSRVVPIFVRLEHTAAGTSWYHILATDSVRYVAVVSAN